MVNSYTHLTNERWATMLILEDPRQGLNLTTGYFFNENSEMAQLHEMSNGNSKHGCSQNSYFKKCSSLNRFSQRVDVKIKILKKLNRPTENA